MTIYGYARVSTEDQALGAQLNALHQFGCDHIFQEKESGRKVKRPALEKLTKRLQSGDSLVVWKLDRLGRTTKQLIDFTFLLKEKGIIFISLQEQLDTSTPLGKFYFTLMAGLAEMEVDLIRERTLAGLEAARLEGRIGGRPAITKDTQHQIQELYAANKYSLKEIGAMCGVSVTTVSKYARLI